MTSSIMTGLLHKPGQSVFLNPSLMARNVLEFDVPQAILDELAPLAEAARTMEEDKATYTLPGGQRLYNQRPAAWKSDICWLSNADEASY